MPTTTNLRALLHRKRWEPCTVQPVANANGGFIVAADMGTQLARIFEVQGVSAIYAYYGAEDAWVQLPNSGLGGTFGTSACGEFHPDGPSSAPTAGTTTTITTSLTLVRDLRGHRIRITAGPNAGLDFIIKSNTIGANSVITITTTAATAFTVASTFTIRSGRLWVFVPSATAPAFGYYDWALNTWIVRAVTGLPTAWATEGQLIGTDSLRSGSLSSGTSTGTNTTTTLNDTGKAWGVNVLANLQVRISGGTGAGQVRAIASNTSNALTVNAVWTTTPDATSTYVVEGQDDAFYLLGNAALTLYKYSIAGNTWTTVAPGTARAAVTGGGMTADWVVGVTDADWVLASGQLNARYIYSFRGGVSNVLDRYDIALNAWSVIPYGDQNETLTAGSCSVTDRERIYILKDSTNRLFYFDVVLNTIRPFNTLLYGASTATAGDKLAITKYVDGATEIPFLFLRRPSGIEMFRMMVIK
jgi:hypothetical protein